MKTGDINKVRRERRKTHGDFTAGARFVQIVMKAAQESPSWSKLTDVERECVHHVQQKIQRIVCGQPHPDHWTDVAGYAMIAAEQVAPVRKRRRVRRVGGVKAAKSTTLTSLKAAAGLKKIVRKIRRRRPKTKSPVSKPEAKE